MSDRLMVATRKGLFLYERGAGGAWNVGNESFIGDPVTMVLSDPRDGALYAALDLGHFGPKLHRSDDGARTWTEVSVPEYPAAKDDDDKKALKVIWSLEPAGADRDNALWAGTIPGGLFRSEDRGESWVLNDALWSDPLREKWFGGGFDDPGIHSVCVDPRDSRRVVVGVSCGGVWITEDGGASWRVSTRGMYAEYMPPELREDSAIQDPHRVVQSPQATNVFWVQHHNGAFRSTDRGESWQEIKPPPSAFGFAVATHPMDANTAWFVPLVKDECRIPVDGKMVVARTRDGGESFEQLRSGLPAGNAYDVVFRHGLDVDDTGDTLAMGSTTGTLWASNDQGDRFEVVSNYLPPIYCVRFV